jgi:hypothetical protein
MVYYVVWICSLLTIETTFRVREGLKLNKEFSIEILI